MKVRPGGVLAIRRCSRFMRAHLSADCFLLMSMLPWMAWYLPLYSSHGLPCFVHLFTCHLRSERDHSTLTLVFFIYVSNLVIFEVSWRGRVSHIISERTSTCNTVFKSRLQNARDSFQSQWCPEQYGLHNCIHKICKQISPPWSRHLRPYSLKIRPSIPVKGFGNEPRALYSPSWRIVGYVVVI